MTKTQKSPKPPIPSTANEPKSAAALTPAGNANSDSGAGAIPPPAAPAPKGKIEKIIDLLRRPEGAVLHELMDATGWQAHSVRGAMSGSIKKKLGLEITSLKTDGVRTYRIAAGADQ